MNKLPTYIQAIPGQFKVLREQMEGRDAEVNFGEMTITIDPTLPPAKARSALLHEMLHICFYGRASAFTDDQEEALVTFLEPLLFDILERNGFAKLPNYGRKS